MFCWYLLNYAIVFSDAVAVLTARHLPVRVAKPCQVHQSQGVFGGFKGISSLKVMSRDAYDWLSYHISTLFYPISSIIAACSLVRPRVGVTIIVWYVLSST